MDEYKFAQMARDILESMCGFVATDKEGRIIYINEQSRKMLGKTQKECIGRPV